MKKDTNDSNKATDNNTSNEPMRISWRREILRFFLISFFSSAVSAVFLVLAIFWVIGFSAFRISAWPNDASDEFRDIDQRAYRNSGHRGEKHGPGGYIFYETDFFMELRMDEIGDLLDGRVQSFDAHHKPYS